MAAPNPFAQFAFKRKAESDEAVLQLAEEEMQEATRRREAKAEAAKKRKTKPKAREDDDDESRRKPAAGEASPSSSSAPTVETLIERWQSVALGIRDVDRRRFVVLVAVLLSPQTTSAVAQRATFALRTAAKLEGAADLTPQFLASATEEDLSQIISTVNYRNTKAKALVDLGKRIKRDRGRIPTTEDGYRHLRGIGHELAGLLVVVNDPKVAAAWCDSDRKGSPQFPDSSSPPAED
mmetsp:Transcript_9790/g.31875  ORF Transcript_9790/g.31875 Transcript_9790/m.31875 type:complete len:237 (-) Transcript_9790:150-860(-)